MKILYGKHFFDVSENEHGRVGFVRVCHFVEDHSMWQKTGQGIRGGEGEGGGGQGVGSWEKR